MSKVTQVTVRYGRKIQPKQYEEKQGLLEAVIFADDGEEVTVNETAAVMAGFIQQVHAALGLVKPAEVPAAPVANSTDEPTKKTGKTRRTKKQIAEDKAEASREQAQATPAADEVPVEGDAPGDPQPADEGVSTNHGEGVSDQELQSAAAGAAAKHGAAKIKDLMKEFDVILLGKLDQPKRLEFLSKLDELGGPLGD